MTKMKLPVSSLLGTPLTEEELKSVIGGNMDITRTCVCRYYKNGSFSRSETVAADSEADCISKCSAFCAGNSGCTSNQFHYTAHS